MTDMTRRDREDLQKVARMRQKLAIGGIGTREAELRADLESQLAATYAFDHDAWADVTRAADAAIEAADGQVAARCRELGIREEFRPKLNLVWYSRGENAMRDRRAELRKVGETRIAAAGKAAKQSIEAKSVEVLSDLITGGLETDAARACLETIPTAEQLMPAITVADVERAALEQKTAAQRARGLL